VGDRQCVQDAPPAVDPYQVGSLRFGRRSRTMRKRIFMAAGSDECGDSSSARRAELGEPGQDDRHGQHDAPTFALNQRVVRGLARSTSWRARPRWLRSQIQPDRPTHVEIHVHTRSPQVTGRFRCSAAPRPTVTTADGPHFKTAAIGQSSSPGTASERARALRREGRPNKGSGPCARRTDSEPPPPSAARPERALIAIRWLLSPCTLPCIRAGASAPRTPAICLVRVRPTPHSDPDSCRLHQRPADGASRAGTGARDPCCCGLATAQGCVAPSNAEVGDVLPSTAAEY
jgi:hypothetical protein